MIKKVKLAIVGGRDFSNKELFIKSIQELPFKLEMIISGGAKGADAFAQEYALENNIHYVEFLPDWGKYGKSAGPKRNKLIVNECEYLIAFWDGSSRGTKSSIIIAKNSDKLYKVYRY